jgi:hypothetical protein
MPDKEFLVMTTGARSESQVRIEQLVKYVHSMRDAFCDSIWNGNTVLREWLSDRNAKGIVR